MGKPRSSHLFSTKRVTRYFKGTPGHDILFCANENETNMKLLAYSGVEIIKTEK